MNFSCVWCSDECKWGSCERDYSPYKNRKARFNHGFSEGNAKENDGDFTGNHRKPEIPVPQGSQQSGYTGNLNKYFNFYVSLSISLSEYLLAPIANKSRAQQSLSS